MNNADPLSARPAESGAIRPLAGRKALITGGTTGIGRAIALDLASAGASVMIFGRHEAELQDALQDLRLIDSEIAGVTADVSRPGDLDRVYAEVDSAFGGLDILIANAGIAADGADDESERDARYAVRTNLTGAIGCCQRAVDRMCETGGDIVLIGSVSADTRRPGGSVYAATKAGMQAFAEAFRQEVSDLGIRVCLIQPGKTGSDMIEAGPEEQRRRQKEGTMLKAEDIAAGVRYALTQPDRCNVAALTIQPARQA